MSDETKRLEHPSFGLISIHHVNGHSTLFGSPIQHMGTIRLQIHTAAQYRSLHEDKYIHKDVLPIIEVEMSESQFARMITSPNCGEGEPCTLRQINFDGKKFRPPPPPRDDLSQSFHDDVKADVSKAASNIKDLYQRVSELFAAKKVIGVNDKAEILKEIGLCLQHVESNMPFVLSMFEEHIEKQVDNAKTEIDSFLKARALQLGMSAIADSVFPVTDNEQGNRLEAGTIETKAVETETPTSKTRKPMEVYPEPNSCDACGSEAPMRWEKVSIQRDNEPKFEDMAWICDDCGEVHSAPRPKNP